jgi:glycosyltransferase involved in cell wall biosynthesis
MYNPHFADLDPLVLYILLFLLALCNLFHDVSFCVVWHRSPFFRILIFFTTENKNLFQCEDLFKQRLLLFVKKMPKHKNNRVRRRQQQRSGPSKETSSSNGSSTTSIVSRMSGVQPKICLCMIVKNESKIITRCLDAARPVLDYVSIVDTGSTDDTKTIIEEWCAKEGLSCKVHEEVFQNFSYNRTHSYQAAKASFPDSDYFLLLDADMVLVVKPDFHKSQLVGDVYMLEQFSHSIRYWNIRLLGNKNVEKWECIGVTHEFWRSTPDTKSKRFLPLEIDDREDGGCKSDKYVRDERLLLEGYEDPETPDDLKTRYSYYLGQTYECMRNYEEAVKWFTKRSEEKGTWEEESWYAQYKKAQCLFMLDRKDEAVCEYLQAFSRRPWRIEPLYKLVCYYRAKHPTPDKGSAMNEIALMFAMRAKESPYPKNDVLFVEYDIYEYLLDVEIAIVAYYVSGKKNIGKAAAKRLKQKLSEKNVKAQHVSHVQSVIKFYGF